mmetsp:Transcript_20556/g.28899  ORF Transcript_20556/g.28899 Transcript_20556/m.28899 type:complete len:225 (-) Transcript_20556:43-717(-)
MEKLWNARRLFQKEGWMLMSGGDITVNHIILMADLLMEVAMAMVDVEAVMDTGDTEMADTETVGMEMVGTDKRMEGVIKGLITHRLTLRRTTGGSNKPKPNMVVATRATTLDTEEITLVMGRNAQVVTRETMAAVLTATEDMEGILVDMDGGVEVAMIVHIIRTVENWVDSLVKQQMGMVSHSRFNFLWLRARKLLYILRKMVLREERMTSAKCLVWGVSMCKF